MAEGLGTGLQNLLLRFKSGSDLQDEGKTPHASVVSFSVHLLLQEKDEDGDIRHLSFLGVDAPHQQDDGEGAGTDESSGDGEAIAKFV